MLEQAINELAVKICKKRGFKTPYELILKPELPMDSKGRDRILIIKAGNPPVICISRIYIQACVSTNQAANLPKLRDTIERALEFMPKMYHTLALVPIADAVALRKDSRRWAKANIPEIKTVLDDRFFKLSYSVTVTDTITETSITRAGNDLQEIIKKAKYDLSRMIMQDEDLAEFRELAEDRERIKKEDAKPNEVSFSVGDDTNEIKMEY